MSGGTFGLEGMTNAQIREMHEEWAEEEKHLQRALAKHMRWMNRDEPHKALAWLIIEKFLGISYEEVFRAGWHDGIFEGKHQQTDTLRNACHDHKRPNCYFGVRREVQPNIEYS